MFLLWVLLLVLQNAAFTWVSRARNSGSDWYHALAAVFSNGIWLAAFFITLDMLNGIETVVDGLLIGLVYIVATVTGSVFMGKFLRTYIEKGRRRVGHYE